MTLPPDAFVCLHRSSTAEHTNDNVLWIITYAGDRIGFEASTEEARGSFTFLGYD